MTPEIMDFISKFLLPLLAAGATFGAIKSELKSLHEKHSDNRKEIERVEHATLRAHERLDSHVETYHRGK